ncbi:MAG TPA: energy-coupling factor transporter transmembrane component T [Candidatus Humimicrobiaceae bacterium]
MQFFEYYEGDSIIHRINPAVKLVLIFILMLAITFVYDPYTPFIFSVLAFLQITVLARIPFKQVIKMILPLLLILAGITITSIISFNTGMEEAPRILFTMGKIEISLNSIKFGLTIGLRILCFLLYSLLFVATTDPTDFIISLILQFKVSPRIGFGTLAGYRFVPLLSTEYQNIFEAHRVRGMEERTGAIAKIKRFKKFAVPLMVTATRKAQRVAIAMDSKCFYAYPRRTYLRDIRIRKADVYYIIIFTSICAIIFITLTWFGILNWGYRSLR